MQITLNTDLDGPNELTALIALCASLGGRLPAAGLTITGDAEIAGIVEAKDRSDRTTTLVSDGTVGPVANAEEAAPPPPPPAAAATGDVDSNGLPWDARIHSESKATIADGSWRKRRGVDDAVYAEVLAELQGQAPPPPPAEQTVPLAPADEQVPPPPVPAEVPSVVADVAPAGGPNLSAFPDFPAFVSAVSKHGKNYQELNELSATVGVAAFKDMKDHGDKWDLFYSMLG